MNSDHACAAPVAGPADPTEDNLLLASKFAVPEPPPFVVTRPQLAARLTGAVRQPVTVVTGPAGSGKTQLVASWVATRPVPERAVWVTVEDGDDAPAVFWSYVVEGLRRAGLPLPDGGADQPFLVRLAAELAGLSRPVVLVLDGVSALTGRRWADDLDFVLQHADRRLRVVLVGRSDPPLPLYRYRLTGRLHEIHGADLVFDAREASELLAAHGVVLAPDALASLLYHTEGWAAGLRLFAMAVQDRADADGLATTLSGDEGVIAEYFLGEVLRDRPGEVREFLLRTSILDTVTPELAQVLTGRADARHTLAELERENAFVHPVDERPPAYRYHRLFAELLRALLVHDRPDEVPALHRRAAGWFAAEGRTADAVAHAVTAGDWSTAAGIVVDDLAVGRLVLGGPADRLCGLFHDLPEDAAGPEAAMVTAALALGAADPDGCAKQLARAEELVGDRIGEYGSGLPLAGRVLDVLLADAYRDAPRVLHSAGEAEPLLARAPVDRIGHHPELLALVRTAKATAQSWLGSVDAAAATFGEALGAAAADGCEAPRLSGLAHLALLEAYRGRLRHATVLANQAVELADRSTPGRPPYVAHAALAWVATERYDVDAAWRHLRAGEPPDGFAAAAAAVVRCRLLRARGEVRDALRVLRDAGRPDGRGRPTWLDRELALSEARLLTAGGRTAEAGAAVDRLVDKLGAPDAADVAVVRAGLLLAEGEPGRAHQLVAPVAGQAEVAVPVAVDARLVLAAIAATGGDGTAAADHLRHALRLATAESQRRAFHEIGARLRPLLREDAELAALYAALGTDARATRATGPRAGDGRAPTGEPVIVDSLSNREMEVLRHVAALLPTEEIAAVMYVSVNTVKTHLRSILRKLSASRRNEAVRRARSLGLI